MFGNHQILRAMLVRVVPSTYHEALYMGTLLSMSRTSFVYRFVYVSMVLLSYSRRRY